MIHAVDVSSYQSGLNVATVPDEAVIIKVTEGTGYVNPHCDTHYQQAKSAGKLLGVYHFAANKANSPQEEAKYFVDNITGYIGNTVLFLDNENSQYNDQSNVAWSLAWCQEVERLTSVKPLVYLNASCVNSYDWSPVYKAGFALWVAAYQSNPPDVNWPNEAQAGWQFSSSYTVPGYFGELDRSVFWLDASGWSAYAAKPVPVPLPVTLPPVVSPGPVETPVVPAPVADTPSTPTEPPVTPEKPTEPVQTPLPIVVPVKQSWWVTLWKTVLRWLKI